MEAPWSTWDESWRLRSTPPNRGGRVLHYLWSLSDKSVVSYTNHLIRSLYEWEHHVILSDGYALQGEAKNPLLRAGATPCLCQDTSAVAHVAALQPTVVVLHSWENRHTLPSAVSAPGPRYIVVYYSTAPQWVAGMYRHVCVNPAIYAGLRSEIKQRSLVIPHSINPLDYPQDKLAQDDPGRSAPCSVVFYGMPPPTDLGGGFALSAPPIEAGNMGLRWNDCAVCRNAAIPTVLELMASATPIISEDEDDAAGLVEDGVTGFLTPRNDEQQLRDKLLWLRDNPKEMRAMGQAARAKCLRENGLVTFRQQWLGVVK